MVDHLDGPGYNDAVLRLCARAGFDAVVTEPASGPMAWETAVRSGGAVGLTTRISAASTLRGITTVQLADAPTFEIHLLSPAGFDEPSPAAASFAALTRRIAAATPQAEVA